MQDSPNHFFHPNQLPKRGGWRLAGLGCLAIIILSGLAALLAWHGFSYPGRGDSAWDKLPAETSWAAEIRGLGPIWRRIQKDPVLQLPLARAAGNFGDWLADAAPIASLKGRDLTEAVESAAFYLSFLAPEVLLFGALPGDDGRFALFRLPPPIRWALGIRDEPWPEVGAGFTAATFDYNGGRLFLASFDGWQVLGVSMRPLLAFAAAGRRAVSPLGSAPTETDPHIHLAIRESRLAPGRSERGTAEPAAPFEPSPFDLAENAAASPAEEEDAQESLYRLTLFPDERGWLAFGAGGGRPDSAAAYAAAGAEEAFPPPGKDVLVQARVSPGLLAEGREYLRRFLGERWPGKLAAAGIRPEPWLLDAWLERVSGDFQLLAARPAVPAADPVPPLPVFSLGWRWLPEAETETAGGDFHLAGRAFLAALAGAEAPSPLPLFRESLVLEENILEGGRRATLNLPPVAANSIRPSWFLPRRNGDAAWLASDPAGLPDEPGPLAAPWDGSAPAAGGIRLDAAWRLSPAFKAALLEAARDRLETLADSAWPQGRLLLEHFDFAALFLDFAASGQLSLTSGGEGLKFTLRLKSRNAL